MTQNDEPPTVGTNPDGHAGDEAYCSACNQSFTPDHVWCPNDGALLVKLKAPKDLLIGRVFEGRYEIRSALGEGGMGTVYRGLQLSLDREVAVKVIHGKLASDRTTAKRFLREARLSSRLNQPNIVNVYEFGQTEDGILYLVMELLRGRSLHQVIQSQFLELDRIQRIGLQLCDALEAAHNQGIIHRDLKPGNIVILDEPVGRDLLKVLDFGLAKSLVNDTSNITNTNALMGTPLYMSPEQIEGRASDQRSDLYSLGCILYQMLTGRPPFVGDTINAVLSSHIRDQPPPLSDRVPPELVAMMARMLAKNPEDRVGSAAEIRETLGVIDVSRPLARSPAPIPRAPVSSVVASVDGPAGARALAMSSSSEPKRRRWLVLVLVAIVVGAGGAYGVARLVRRPGAITALDATVTKDAAAAALDASAIVLVDAAPDAGGAKAASPADARGPIDAKPVPQHVDAGVRPVDAHAQVIPIDASPRPDAQVTPIDAAAHPDAKFVEPQLLPNKRDAGIR